MGNFGIDRYLNGYDLETTQPIKKRCWNGRLCWNHNDKLISKKQIEQPNNRCNFELKQYSPF